MEGAFSVKEDALKIPVEQKAKTFVWKKPSKQFRAKKHPPFGCIFHFKASCVLVFMITQSLGTYIPTRVFSNFKGRSHRARILNMPPTWPFLILKKWMGSYSLVSCKAKLCPPSRVWSKFSCGCLNQNPLGLRGEIYNGGLFLFAIWFAFWTYDAWSRPPRQLFRMWMIISVHSEFQRDLPKKQ